MWNRARKVKGMQVEWEFAEEQSEWPEDWATSTPLTAAAQRKLSLQWIVMVVAVLLLLGGWLWLQAQTGLAQIESEIHAAVESDLWLSERNDPIVTLQSAVANDTQVGVVAPKLIRSEVVNLGENWAVVKMTIEQNNRHYRQSRVYRRSENEWYPASPTASLWGAPRILESTYFTFHYYASDSESVSAAAAKLDALLPTFAASYFPTTAFDSKWSIRVSPEPSSTESLHDASNQTQLVILSPSVILSPIEIGEGDLLVQSVVLKALHVWGEERVRHHLPAQLSTAQEKQQLRILLDSVQLWQAWSAELPLSPLRKPVVQWIYGEDAGSDRTLPALEAQLCDLHHLWESAPLVVQIPLFCGEPMQGDPYQTWRYLYTSPWHLTDNSIFIEMTPADPPVDLAATIGIATVVEYAASRYGPESIAALIANMPHHSSWQSLIPATFGVSLDDFDSAWQSYLHEEYDVE